MFSRNENRIQFSVFVVGFTTIISQIVLLRNFLSVFGGNELIIGITISNWMLLTALGAYVGKFFKVKQINHRLIFIAHILLGLLPIIIAFLVIYLKNYLLPPGLMVNLIQIYLGSLILLLPFCVVSGLMFSLFSSIYSFEKRSNEIYKIYGIEAIGAIVGGSLFNFIFIFITEAFFTLKLLLVINFSVALFVYFIGSKDKMPWVVGILIIIIAGLIIPTDLSDLAYTQFFKNQKLIEHRETPYGNIAVTKSSDQINFYENGVLLFSSENVIANEENVHYAMLQHPNPKTALLISGGIPGVIDEVLKYNPDSIDYIEIDPELIKLSIKHSRAIKSEFPINIIVQDARLFLKETDKQYDVILINLPDPSSSFINRYFTLEFFEELKENLNPAGVLATSLSGTSNYMSNESIQLHTALYSTMRLVFNYVMIIPGQRNYFIASDLHLSHEIAGLMENSYIENHYVNQFYLDDELIYERKNLIENQIKQNVIINYDFTPTTYLLQMKLWLSKFNAPFIYFIALGLIILFVIIRLNIINHGLFITGFSSTSLELLLLIAFQVIYGYVYFMVGTFITVFMIGLVSGNLFLIHKIKVNYRNFSMIQYAMGITAIFIPILLIQMNVGAPAGFIVHTVFIALMGLIGLLTGLQFSLGTKLRTVSIEQNASSSYAADSLGSGFGALVVTTLLIPLLGIVKVCLIIGIINFITGLYILIYMRNK